MVAVVGTVTLTDPTGYTARTLGAGERCTGQDGYDDIAAGAGVVVADDAGRTLALGRLAGGRLSGSSFYCVFRFRVSVPAGLRFYGVTVSHRGTVKVAESDLGSVALSLG